MTKSVNKVILIGNVGAEPEIRNTMNGLTIAILTLATSNTTKNKESGMTEEKTEWHRVVFFGQLAKIIGDYVHKGSKLYIEGALHTKKWTDKNGVERYTTEIVAREMQMLDKREHAEPFIPKPVQEEKSEWQRDNGPISDIPF